MPPRSDPRPSADFRAALSPTGARWLLLVPTALERDHLGLTGTNEAPIELAGFGPVAAAACCAAAIAKHDPERVLLVGIAGSFDVARFALGSASTFGEVVMDGVGVGEGRARQLPSALGFPQLAHSTPPLFERAELADGEGLLVTTPAASADAAEASARAARFPGALAEDMEGFGVALACRLLGRPLTIVRGASNRVGDRTYADWKIQESLAAARLIVRALLDAESPAH